MGLIRHNNGQNTAGKSFPFFSIDICFFRYKIIFMKKNLHIKLDSLLRMTRAWDLELKLNDLVNRITQDSSELFGFDRSGLMVIEEKGLILRSVWAKPEYADHSDDGFVSVGSSVVKSGRTVFSQKKGKSEKGFIVGIPLSASRGTIGSLLLETYDPAKELSRNDQKLLKTLGEQAASAMQHSILYHSAITDPLTNLFSHRHFQLQADQAIRQARRSKQQVSLIILDLDTFKKVNDTYGHETGNVCLVQTADILRSTLRSSDIIARFGGDEFEILLPDTSDEGLARIGEKILEMIRMHRFPKAGTITTSIGGAVYPVNAASAQELFIEADNALYEAKKSGRDRFIQAETKAPGLPDAAKERKEKQSKYAASTSVSAGEGDIAGAQTAFPELLDLDRITPAGELIDGHHVIKFIAKGSLGEVLLVRQPELDRQVALKRPLTPHLSEKDEEQFEKEAKTTASLKHPGVIPVYTMGRDSDGRRYYTMKPLSGRSLGSVLEGRKDEKKSILREFTVNRLVEVVYRTAETLSYAHEHHVSHLDITPDNIMIGEFGEVSVIDWGLSADPAGSSDKKTSSDYIVGTGLYKGPEFFNEYTSEPGPHSDIYALGAVLYEVLTSSPPYERETISDSIEAVKKGELEPPEVRTPEAGIDPALSGLCMASLSPDVEKRPSIKDFADTLGRHIRGEREWRIIRFGDNGDRIDPSEWVQVMGTWEYEGEEFITQGDNEHIIIWKTPTSGSYRFVCEGWIERGGELSLIGNGINPETLDQDPYKGYHFQFGAEYSTCTKLARNGHDVLAKPGFTVEPRKKYRIEIEYNEGWLYCYVNDDRIFTYREIFPFVGRHIGIYSFGKGCHFRPVEIQVQKSGLMLPAMQVANDLFQYGHYREALERYREIADTKHHRLETDEARLKAGTCLKQLGRAEEARRMFLSVTEGVLAPFASASDALLDLDRDSISDQKMGIVKLKKVLSDYPEHQVIAMVIDAASNYRQYTSNFKGDHSLDQEFALKIELLKVGRDTLMPPVQSQLRFQVFAACYMFETGQWQDALDDMLEFRERLLPVQRFLHQFQEIFCVAALANGRDDLLPDSPHDLSKWEHPRMRSWKEDYLFHIVTRTYDRKQFCEEIMSGERKPGILETENNDIGFLARDTILQCFLADNDVKKAGEFIEEYIIPHQSTDTDREFEPYVTGGSIIGSGCAELFERWIEYYSSSSEKRTVTEMIRVLKARFFIAQGDPEQAASELEHADFHFAHDSLSCRPIIAVQALLSSLGFLKIPEQSLRNLARKHLSGTALDLFRMVTGEKKPEPGPLWPHPLWQTELRFWLCLWLEYKGEKDSAKDIILPCRDERYGSSCFQPAVRAMLERLKR